MKLPVQTIPTIEEMTMSEKLQLLEALWEDLSRNSMDLEPPEWHREILKERRQAVKNDELEYIDWDEAKKQLRDLD